MADYIYILLFPPACVMTITDIRSREVGMLWLGWFALASFGVAIALFGWQQAAINACGNMLVLGLMMLGVSGYISVRYRDSGRQLNSFVGTGDLVFLLLLTPLFSLREFVWFLIASFCVTLLGWVVLAALSGRKSTIPLVATLCFSLAAYLIYKQI